MQTRSAIVHAPNPSFNPTAKKRFGVPSELRARVCSRISGIVSRLSLARADMESTHGALIATNDKPIRGRLFCVFQLSLHPHFAALAIEAKCPALLAA